LKSALGEEFGKIKHGRFNVGIGEKEDKIEEIFIIIFSPRYSILYKISVTKSRSYN
jgi:hypothetical protein